MALLSQAELGNRIPDARAGSRERLSYRRIWPKPKRFSSNSPAYSVECRILQARIPSLSALADDAHASSLEAKYRALLEQIPAVVFMAYVDRGVSEAYVSPEIEAALGYSREEWLEDPVRWYEHIHPDDKQRWSLEAAEHVCLRQAASLLLPGDRARRSSRLVPLRCPHGAPSRRTALVHPRRGLRHLRHEAHRERRFSRNATLSRQFSIPSAPW